MKTLLKLVYLCIFQWILILISIPRSEQSAINSITGSLRVNTAQSQCAEHEYGQNCTYCVPQDTCHTGHYTCDDTTGSKICLPGYRGNDCMEAEVQGTFDYQVKCPENDCRNGGTCTSGKCCCGRGFGGVLCEIEIIECRNNSCLNGGVCKDLVGNFECLCKPSFTGDNCEIRSDAHARTTPSLGDTCKTTQCLNGGTCFEDMYFTYCLCPTNYSGKNCENDQRSHPIQTNDCPANYYGKGCRVFCTPQNDCHGHYICEQSTGSKICLSGWYGNRCDTRILPQNLDPECPRDTACKNDGQCMLGECCCRHNYTGKYCQIESIGCLSNPCMNNATCYNVGNGFTCACVGNFTGRTCDHVITPPTTTTTPPTTLKNTPEATKSSPIISKSTPTTPSTSQTPPTYKHTTTVVPITTHSNNNTSSPSNHSKSPTQPSSSSSPVTNQIYTPSPTSLSTSYLPSMHSTILPSSVIVSTPSLSSPPSLSLQTSSLSSSSPSSSIPSSLLYSDLATPSFTSQVSPTVTQTSSISSNVTLNLLSLSSTLSTNSSSIVPSPSISFTTATVLTSTILPSASISFFSASNTNLTSIDKSSNSPSAIVATPTASSSVLTTKSALTSNPAMILSSFDGTNIKSTAVVSSSHSEHHQTPPILTSSISRTVSRDTESLVSGVHSTTSQIPQLHSTGVPTTVHKPTKQSVTPVRSISNHLNTIGTPVSPSIKYTGSDVISTIAPDGSETFTNWKIILIVIGCVLLLLLLIILIVMLTLRQRKKDSMYISQSPAELHGYSKEHFSVQPDFNNPSFDVGNDSDDDSVKHDMYVVNK